MLIVIHVPDTGPPVTVVLNSPVAPAHIALGMLGHLQDHTRRLARNGTEPPGDLVDDIGALTGMLMPPESGQAEDRDARTRRLAAARQARYVARLRGEEVPHRKPGRPSPIVSGSPEWLAGLHSVG